jgi:hypothetical protein
VASRFGMAGEESPAWVRIGVAGTDGAVSRALAGTGLGWHGEAGPEWIGVARIGPIRQDSAGFTRSGLARQVGA